MLASELDPLDAIVLSAFGRLETIPGRKTLQKLVYFLKESGLDIGFQFQWDKFGPYSIELNYYVEDLVAEGLIESETKKVPLTTAEEGAGIQYNFRLSQGARELSSSVDLIQGDKAKIDRVIELLREVTPRNLELYASVHYIVKFFSTKGERTHFPDGVVNLMNDYKPGRFTPEEIKKAYFNLRSRGWL